MTVLLTNEGLAHVTALTNAGALSHDYTRIIFGAGNNIPAADDDFDALTNKLDVERILGDAVYPKLNDQDPRNTGRGASTWTWKFVIEPTGSSFVASNLHIVDELASGADLSLVSVSQVIDKLAHQRLIIWFNTHVTDPSTLVVAYEEPEMQRTKHAFTPRALTLAAYSGTSSSPGDQIVARPGETVRVMALLQGYEGQVLQASEIANATMTIFGKERIHQWKRKGYVTAETPDQVVTDDARYPHSGGYNVAAEWAIPRGRAALGEYELCLEVIEGTKLLTETWTVTIDLPPSGIGR